MTKTTITAHTYVCELPEAIQNQILQECETTFKSLAFPVNIKEELDNVTDIDVSYYEDDLNTITKDVQSKLLDDVNRKSLIAVIAYAYMQDENYEEWFENYFKRVDTYDIDQKKNYLNMRNDLITFNKGAVA